jgi:hypothetical protein
MTAEPDYYLDIEGIEGEPSQSQAGRASGRKWIGVEFECCGVYARIYRNREGTAYEGCCPRCVRRVRVSIGPGGTNHRLFRAK